MSGSRRTPSPTSSRTAVSEPSKRKDLDQSVPGPAVSKQARLQVPTSLLATGDPLAGPTLVQIPTKKWTDCYIPSNVFVLWNLAFGDDVDIDTEIERNLPDFFALKAVAEDRQSFCGILGDVRRNRELRVRLDALRTEAAWKEVVCWRAEDYTPPPPWFDADESYRMCTSVSGALEIPVACIPQAGILRWCQDHGDVMLLSITTRSPWHGSRPAYRVRFWDSASALSAQWTLYSSLTPHMLLPYCPFSHPGVGADNDELLHEEIVAWDQISGGD